VNKLSRHYYPSSLASLSQGTAVSDKLK